MKVKTGHTSITDQDVYAPLSKIPPGKVSTYGDIAKALGHPKAARAIGRIIANNPNPILVHVTGLSNQMARLVVLHMGEQRKRQILEKEGIKFQNRIVEKFEEQRLSF
jgi:O-6-methylguanine DNA methyltransferase